MTIRTTMPNPTLTAADLDAEFARIEAMTDEEILADAKARGVDIVAEHARVKELLLEAYRKARAAKDRLLADPEKYR